MLIAQTCAFLIFKDLADISQWLVQSTREFTMMVWYNRHIITAAGLLSLLAALLRDNRLARVNTLKSRLFWFIFVEFFPGTDVNRA